MSEFLDHAITVRDVLYFVVAMTVLLLAVITIAAAWLRRHDRKITEANVAYAENMRQQVNARENTRNPAFGTQTQPIEGAGQPRFKQTN